VDHRSFRDQLAFSIGFAVTRSRELLRRILKEHSPDDARQQLAARVIAELKQSGVRDRRDGAGYAEAPAEPDARVARNSRSPRPRRRSEGLRTGGGQSSAARATQEQQLLA
jgi:hypothetical protein